MFLQVCVCPQGGGCYPSMPCKFPVPHPWGKFRGIWSRPTAKEKVEGDLVQAHTLRGSSQGGACSRGMCGDPPPTWWLLLRAVRILLECILVFKVKSFVATHWILWCIKNDNICFNILNELDLDIPADFEISERLYWCAAWTFFLHITTLYDCYRNYNTVNQITFSQITVIPRARFLVVIEALWHLSSLVQLYISIISDLNHSLHWCNNCLLCHFVLLQKSDSCKKRFFFLS